MRNKIKEFLTLEERDNVLRQPDQRKLQGLRDFCILGIMVLTGIRRDELCKLNRDSLKVQGKKTFLHIEGKGKGGKVSEKDKGARWRAVPIKDPKLLEALDKYFRKTNALKDPNAPMFFNIKYFRPEGPKRIGWATIRFLVQKYVRMALIQKRITPHSLRHTFVTLGFWAGNDAPTMAALAGHSNISTTSRYAHTSEERMEKAIESLRL